MSDSKPKRRYNSSRRHEQARQTRQQISASARNLFIQRGYAGATIEAIARDANVSPETIYAVFSNKRNILSHILDIAVGGDDAPVPLLHRPEPQAVLHETKQTQQLEMFAQNITDIMERVAPIFEIMRVAAKTEPEIAELTQQSLKTRWQNMEKLVERILANGALRDGVNKAQATDIIWTLTSAEVFRLLTVDRTWSKEQYIEWLADSLKRLLLP
jgi:AcrR family transcriptional regulator